ncbi:MalM family protein [Vibrio methylphosphonaticus]|uniref:MalM family protein n=1 Tax=Vibrio methylphosphonaticus TaxID=2946866 RepID=UPI002029D781|nr:MalM family protein [Vibrio methylphosphonaticus]MCL9776907.1 MalM family protein [Vibrio methylphosphonaticus]
MNKNILALVLGLSVVGCASHTGVEPTISIADMNASDTCCVSKKDFAWIPLDKTENVGFSIDTSSPVWEFKTGKSYFNAFEFSPQSGNVKVTIDSKMLNKEVFAPTVQLLDADYNVVRTIGLDDFDVRFSDMFDANRYVSSFEVDAQSLPYMVVYTRPSDVGKVVSVPHPAKVRAQESGEPLPIVTDPKFIQSYAGELNLEVETLTLGARKTEPAVVKNTSAAVVPAAVLSDTVNYYHTAIQKAVAQDNIPKALSLLDEAKALNIEGAQEVFVKAINSKK